MIISIGGDHGSGKSTVSKMLASRLGYERFYAGGYLREKARAAGMTLEAFMKIAERDDSIDKEVDFHMKELGETKDDLIVEGRTAFYFVPHSFKVYISVDPKEAARRVFDQMQREGSEGRNEDLAESVEAQMALQAGLTESYRKRYMEYYGFDNTDLSQYDLVIDSSDMTPEEVVGQILESTGLEE